MFVKEEDERIETNKKDQSNILSSSRDWSLSVDLEERLRILADITFTKKRKQINYM